MHRSIPGLTSALNSIANAHVPLVNEKKKQSWRLNHSFDDAEVSTVDDDPEVIARKLKEQEVNQFYADIGSCTARIASKLREMDNIDLNPETKNDGVSNQKRFLDDQITRAQAALPTEFYMRKLNAKEVNQEIIEIDERITFNARNWKTSLLDIGLKESDIDDPNDPITSITSTNASAVAAASVLKAKMKKIPKKQFTYVNGVKTKVVEPEVIPSFASVASKFKTIAKERPVDDLSMEEMDQINDEVQITLHTYY
jgi:hypothetical protein